MELSSDETAKKLDNLANDMAEMKAAILALTQLMQRPPAPAPPRTPPVQRPGSVNLAEGFRFA